MLQPYLLSPTYMGCCSYPEDCPPRSPTTEAALQTSDLDWVDEVEQAAPSQPELEEETVEEGCYQDPCLPSLLCEPIPREGCSEQRFEQGSSQSDPDLREECVREMEWTVCHLDTSNAILHQDSNTHEAGHCHLGVRTLTRYGVGGVKMARRPLHLSDTLLSEVRF